MNFFSYEFDPTVKFDMYTSMHVLMLGITLVLVILFFVFKNRIYNSPKEKQIRHGFAYFLIGMLITLITVDTVGGEIYLPFHLCSISYILTIILLLTSNEKIFGYVYFTGIIGGIVTFAIPDLYHAGYNRFRFYEFIIAHTTIILIPIYYLTNFKYKITLRTTITGIIITNIIGFSMLPVNLLLRSTGIVEEANFMFTMGPPEDVESVFGTFPWHMLSFELVLLITFFALYYITKWYQNRIKAA